MHESKVGTRPTRGLNVAMLLVVCGGVALRTLGLERGLWFDEAWVLDSVRSSTLHEMFYYSGWAQTTPPGVLLTLRAAQWLTGTVPEHMRALPFVCGTLTLVLLARLFQDLLAAPFALLATLVVAVSPEIIWYATEIKQYAFDLLAATLVLRSGVKYLEQPCQQSLWRWFALYAACSPFAYTLVFFLPAMALVVVLVPAVPAPASRLRAAFWPVLLAAALSFALQIIFARPNADLESLRAFWTDGFMTSADASIAYFLRRMFDELYAFLPIDASTRERVAVLLLLDGLGVAQFWRRAAHRGAVACALPLLLIVPALGVVAANALGAYPVSEFRMLYFLIGPATLLAVAGLAGVTEILVVLIQRPSLETLLALLLCVVTAVGVNVKRVHTAHSLKQWDSRLDVRALVRYLHDVDGLARPIYVHAALRQLVSEYAHQYPLTARSVAGDVGWPCCVPGRPWRRPEFNRADIESEMARVLPQQGPGVSYLVLRKNADIGEGREQDLFVMAAAAHGCTTPWSFETKALELVKLECTTRFGAE